MTIKEILKNWLYANAYDGLINHEKMCSCYKDDIAPCGAVDLNACKGGHKVACDKTCGKCDCEFHIALTHPQISGAAAVADGADANESALAMADAEAEIDDIDIDESLNKVAVDRTLNNGPDQL